MLNRLYRLSNSETDLVLIALCAEKHYSQFEEDIVNNVRAGIEWLAEIHLYHVARELEEQLDLHDIPSTGETCWPAASFGMKHGRRKMHSIESLCEGAEDFYVDDEELRGFSILKVPETFSEIDDFEQRQADMDRRNTDKIVQQMAMI
jgi:hypothetical protein